MTTSQSPAPPSAAAVTSLATAVGRYFAAVSLVPGLILVAVVFVLAKSGAWSGPPDFSMAFTALTELSLGGALGLIMVALIVGALLHPIQLATLQLLEGYWGFGRLGIAARSYGIRRHRERREYLHQIERRSASNDPWGARLEKDTARMWRSIYPKHPEHVMPTRLGNVLRAAETRVGSAVGLDVGFAPHLLQVAPPEHVEYVNDQRTNLDLVVRIWLTCVLSSGIGVVYLWPHGLYLLIALGPYLLALLAYRGAVAAAREYGAALQVLFDLDRFALYERMRLPLPDCAEAERKLVQQIVRLSLVPRNEAVNNPSYRHPVPDIVQAARAIPYEYRRRGRR